MSTVAVQSQLTPERVDRVEQSLRVNPNWNAAADYAGCGYRTLRRYCERGERYQALLDGTNGAAELAGGEAHADYAYWQAWQRWTKARAQCEQELVNLLMRAAKNGNTQVMQWLLKVGWRDRYNERIEITGASGGPVAISVEERTEALVERVREHQARCAKKPTRKKNAPEGASA